MKTQVIENILKNCCHHGTTVEVRTPSDTIKCKIHGDTQDHFELDGENKSLEIQTGEGTYWVDTDKIETIRI